MNEIRTAMDAGLYRIALIGALTIPDVCAQLRPDTPDWTGDSKVGTRYREWYDKYAKDRCEIDAAICYKYRCSMVHQGRSTINNNTKIAFYKPDIPFSLFMNCDFNITFHAPDGSIIEENAKVIDVRVFVYGMIESAEQWLNNVKDDPEFKKNCEYLLQERLNNPLQHLIGGINVTVIY